VSEVRGPEREALALFDAVLELEPPEREARLAAANAGDAAVALVRAWLAADAGDTAALRLDRARHGLVQAVAETTAEPCEGERVGPYRLVRELGRGGMGVVYLAQDLRLHRMVALKTLPAMSPSWVASLLGEARAMAAVAHPSVAVLYSLEQWRGTPVLVTEYLSGGTLASRLSVGRVPVAEALHLGAAIADALAVLHARGWLHRDIKPSNIGFAHDGALKLLDFGLTQWRPTLEDAAAPAAGTPLYLSPEILGGEPASQHDDVWALALTVVEMITGTHPFVAGRVNWEADMPDAVAHVLTQALHPARSRRLGSAHAFAAALRTAGGGAVAC
jgi:serine/threonine protein kinase